MINPEYKQIREQAWSEGWHHWQRIALSRWVVEPVAVHHAIPFETDTGSVAIVHPSPRMIAELMHGGIHPPIEAIFEQRLELEIEGGRTISCDYMDAQTVRAAHRVTKETVVDNSAAHLSVTRAMTYDQAIEYVVKKDVPFAIWGLPHNRPRFAIVPRSAIPADRTHRNDWNLKEIAA